MIRPTFEILIEDTGLYAIVRDAGETLGIVGSMDDRDALMATVVERWPTIDHADLDD